MSDILERIVVSEPNFTRLGFVRNGEFLTRGSLLVWICEDDDRGDMYFCEGKRIKSEKDLNELIERK